MYDTPRSYYTLYVRHVDNRFVIRKTFTSLKVAKLYFSNNFQSKKLGMETPAWSEIRKQS